MYVYGCLLGRLLKLRPIIQGRIQEPKTRYSPVRLWVMLRIVLLFPNLEVELSETHTCQDLFGLASVTLVITLQRSRRGACVITVSRTELNINVVCGNGADLWLK